jgi:hypothetical protein
MAGFRSVLRRARVIIEANGSAGVESAESMSIFDDLRFTSAVATGAEESLPDESAVQSLHQRRQVQQGLRSGTCEISGILVPPATVANSTYVSAPDALTDVLRCTLGMSTSDALIAGSAVVASPSPTSTTFSVTPAQGGRLLAGQWCAVETGAGTNLYEPVLIKTRSTDAITLCWALSFTPATAAKVLNFEQFYLTQGLPSATESLQLYVQGEDTYAAHLMLGCQGPLSLDWTNGQLPTWSLSLSAMSFLTESEMANPDGTLSQATMPGGTPIPVNGAVILSPISGTLRTLPICPEIKWALGSAWQSEPSYNGVEGKAQMVMVRGDQATCSMLVRAADRSWDAIWEAGTKYRIAQYAGNTGAGMLAMAFPTAELIARPVLESPNGIDYWRLTWGALMNEDSGGAVTDAGRAPFIFGRG